MSKYRDQILAAEARAADTFARFEPDKRTSVDVVGIATELSIPVLFRPMDGLWGAAVTVDGEHRGALVTTKLDLHVQRFTLAHELGHMMLGHKTSLDVTVDFAGRHGDRGDAVEEMAANAFASTLLAPKSLMLRAAKRHQWTRAALSDPNNVYQLGLRLGLSMPAISWALVTHGVLTQDQASEMRQRPVKEMKRSLAPAELITDSWANVWKLTPPDTDTTIEAGPEDLFAVHVQDEAGAGYLWNLVDASGDVLTVREVDAQDEGTVGGSVTRTVFLRLSRPGRHRLFFEHTRPWGGDNIGQIDILVQNEGKEMGGLPRRIREKYLMAEAAA